MTASPWAKVFPAPELPACTDFVLIGYEPPLPPEVTAYARYLIVEGMRRAAREAQRQG